MVSYKEQTACIPLNLFIAQVGDTDITAFKNTKEVQQSDYTNLSIYMKIHQNEAERKLQEIHDNYQPQLDQYDRVLKNKKLAKRLYVVRQRALCLGNRLRDQRQLIPLMRPSQRAYFEQLWGRD